MDLYEYLEKVATQKEAKGLKKSDKFKKVMGEFEKGTLHSGSPDGPVVTDPKQAVAIALSEAKRKKKGKK